MTIFNDNANISVNLEFSKSLECTQHIKSVSPLRFGVANNWGSIFKIRV